MSFKKNKYIIVRNALDKTLNNFILNYLLFKKQAVDILYHHKKIPLNSTLFGIYNDEQCPNTYSHYADMVAETLLMYLLPTIEKKTKLKLIPTYSYLRIYKNGDILKKHIDRPSCEISVTLNVEGAGWDIFMGGKPLSLNPTDLIIYKGMEIAHWREPFKGDRCVQIFLHYNDVNGLFKKENLYDKRPWICLP